jgi:hypothetical protein
VAVQTAPGKRPYLEVFGTDYPTPDGTCVRDYIHVSDLTRAHLAALEHLRAGGESQVLNCGYGTGFSGLEVIAAVKRVSGSNFTLRFGERWPGDPAALVAEAHRISEVLGWRPAYADLDSIVRDALTWERRLIEDREQRAIFDLRSKTWRARRNLLDRLRGYDRETDGERTAYGRGPTRDASMRAAQMNWRALDDEAWDENSPRLKRPCQRDVRAPLLDANVHLLDKITW